MKKVELTISERYAALPILNDFKGKLDELAVILEDIKQFPITEEEWKNAGRKMTMLAKQKASGIVATVDIESFNLEKMEKVDDKISISWDDDKAGTKEIELNDITVNYIKKYIQEKSDKGELSVADKVFITLLAKISK